MLSPPAPRLDAVRAGPGARVAVRVLLLGAVATLAAVAFVLAPVRQPEVTYTWTPADGSAVALPLMPYQPVTLTATVSCAAARAGVRLSTVPPVPDPEAAPLAGLTLVGTPADVAVTSGGTALGPVALPAGDCTLLLTSDAAATTVSIDGAPVLRHDGDVRPDVAGVFGDGFTGGTAAVTVVADTRFATTPTPVKLGLGAVCLLALAGLGGALARADRRWSTRRVRLLPRGVARPRTVDAAVTALLLVWWAVGAGTVDDGYLAGIVRGRAENGFVGNAYRWLNAPEAPFSWFVEPYHWWTLAAPSGVPSTPWMRLPSTLLGLVCWVLVSRLLVPRLGSAGRRRGTAWVAALAFGTWWVPFGLGLRPEPWVAVGAVLVFVAVERALATGRVLPLAAALTAAGTTAAVTPGGLLAFAPVLAAAVPLLRRQRARTDLQLTGAWPALPLLAVIVAAPAAALLLMAADQGAAALAEAVRVRGVIGGGRPWAEESVRYALLLTPGEIQGTIGRRAAVLTTVLAAAALAWVLAGRGGPRAGIAPGPTRRLLVTLALAAVAMTFSPTKWTQHFGALAGLGTAVLTLGLVAFGPRAWRAVARHDPALARRQRVAGLGAVTAVGALVLAGRNAWPFVGAWYTPTFSTLPPQVPVPGGDVPVSTLVIAVGGAVTAAALARSAWRRSGTGSAFRTPGRRHSPEPPREWRRRGVRNAHVVRAAATVGTSPAVPMAAVLVAVLALQVLSLARVAVAHPDGYTPAADLRATLAGDPCGLQSALLVETDPAAGVLSPVPSGPAAPPGLPPATVDAGGSRLPGIAASGPGATPWYALDTREPARPVVVTVAGSAGGLAAEFGRAGQVLTRVPLGGGDTGPTDRRLPVPAGADTVRLAVAAGPGGAPTGPVVAAASLPRVPVLTPMDRVLPRGTTAILDWPVAFVFPCLRPAPLPPGTAALPRWRVAPPADDTAAAITYAPDLGGPFATARLLVTQHRLPTYLRDDPIRATPQLYRWDPVVPLRTLSPSVRDGPVPGAVTPLRVPRL